MPRRTTAAARAGAAAHARTFHANGATYRTKPVAPGRHTLYASIARLVRHGGEGLPTSGGEIRKKMRHHLKAHDGWEAVRAGLRRNATAWAGEDELLLISELYPAMCITVFRAEGDGCCSTAYYAGRRVPGPPSNRAAVFPVHLRATPSADGVRSFEPLWRVGHPAPAGADVACTATSAPWRGDGDGAPTARRRPTGRERRPGKVAERAATPGKAPAPEPRAYESRTWHVSIPMMVALLRAKLGKSARLPRDRDALAKLLDAHGIARSPRT